MQPNQIVQAAHVEVYLGIVGSAMPATLAAPGAGWWNVGLTNPESARFRVSPEFEQVMAHQSNYPVKILQTTDAAGMDVDLLQWNGDNFRAVYGGGSIARITGTPNLFRFVPPAFGGREELAAILDVVYGAKTYRFMAGRVFNQSETELELNKSPETKLPLRLSILGGDAIDAWSMLTNDPAFDPGDEALTA